MSPSTAKATDAAPDSTPLIELRGVTRVYPAQGEEEATSVTALAEVSLQIGSGEFVCITGPSGSGKTTLMNILGCLDRPTEGTYRIAGKDTTSLPSDDLARLRRDTLGFVFQNYNLLESATAQENVELPATYAGLPRGQRQRRARDVLEAIGMGDRLEHRPAELSGGEQQRVAIARALMNGARVILADEPTGALDTQQGDEVLALLQQLSARGHAVILISHDKTVAAHADRRIELRDGRVVEDSGTGSVSHATDAPRETSAGGIGWLSAVRGGLLALRSGRLRAALMVCSIALGIWSVVALLGLAEGARRDALAAVERMGANRFLIEGFQSRSSGAMIFLSRTLADAQALQKIPNVQSVMPIMQNMLVVQVGDHVDKVIVRGISETAPKTMQNVSWPLEFGTFLTRQDNNETAQVAVIGPTIRNALFTGIANPVGENIYIGGLPFVVKGVLSPHPRLEGDGEILWFNDQQYEDIGKVVYIPIMTASDVLMATDKLSRLYVLVEDVSRIEKTAADIQDLMFRRHGSENQTEVTNYAEMFSAHKKLSAIHAAIFATLAGVALLVGGLGIMSVTLAAVSQRRREIGIRMAVGARRRDISVQFLVETCVLTTVGGACGALLAFAGSPVLSDLAGAPVANAPWFFPMALGCAVATGLVFGIVPARRAARLDPVEALAAE